MTTKQPKAKIVSLTGEPISTDDVEEVPEEVLN